MKKSIGFFGILMIFLVSLLCNVNAITSVTGIPTTVTIIEDTPNSTAIGDLDTVATLGGVVGTITWSATSSTNIQVTIDSGNVVTLTPASNFAGTESVTITATDDNGTPANTADDTSVDTGVSVTVSNVNDAPVLSLANQKAQEGLQFTYEDYASDNADPTDTLTYSYEVISAPSDSTFSSSNFATATGKITWTPEEDDIGELELKINVTDNGSPSETVTGTFIIDVYPDFMCDEGEKGSGLDISIDEPDNGDNYAPGDKINLEINVDNDATDMDVIVEAFLYNVDQNDKVDEAESDSVDIDDGDDYDFDEGDGLSLEIPYDLEFDNGDEFRIYVKAYEDGDEDKYCISDSISIDIEREDNAVMIEKAKLTPSIVNPGDTIELVVDVLNIGDKDQDDVTVSVVRSDLNINEVSTRFDLEKFDDSDNDATKRFTLTIPSTAKPGKYSIEVNVLDEDEDVYDVDEATVFVELTVSGEAANEEASLGLTQTSFEQKQGESFNIPIKVKNDENSEATFIVEISPVGGWADVTTEIITVGAGKETTIYPTLTIKSTATTGSSSAKVSLKSQTGTALDSKTISVNIKSKGVVGDVTYTSTNKWFSKDSLTSVFWIIGDLALVVVVIYFIKLIFIKPR